MIWLVSGFVIFLIVFTWAQVAMLLPRLIYRAVLFLAGAFVFFFLGFFIVRAVWPDGHAESYNKTFEVVRWAVIAVFALAMFGKMFGG